MTRGKFFLTLTGAMLLLSAVRFAQAEPTVSPEPRARFLRKVSPMRRALASGAAISYGRKTLQVRGVVTLRIGDFTSVLTPAKKLPPVSITSGPAGSAKRERAVYVTAAHFGFFGLVPETELVADDAAQRLIEDSEVARGWSDADYRKRWDNFDWDSAYQMLIVDTAVNQKDRKDFNALFAQRRGRWRLVAIDNESSFDPKSSFAPKHPSRRDFWAVTDNDSVAPPSRHLIRGVENFNFAAWRLDMQELQLTPQEIDAAESRIRGLQQDGVAFTEPYFPSQLVNKLGQAWSTEVALRKAGTPRQAAMPTSQPKSREKNIGPGPEPIVTIRWKHKDNHHQFSHLSAPEYEQLRDGMMKIDAHFPRQKHVYIGVGRSSAAGVAFFNALDSAKAAYWPMDGLKTYLEPGSGGLTPAARQEFEQIFAATLPTDVAQNSRNIVLFQASDTGASLPLVKKELKRYLAARGLSNVKIRTAVFTRGNDATSADSLAIHTSGSSVLAELSSDRFHAIAPHRFYRPGNPKNGPSGTIWNRAGGLNPPSENFAAFSQAMTLRVNHDPSLQR